MGVDRFCEIYRETTVIEMPEEGRKRWPYSGIPKQKGESGNFANLSGAVRERVLLKVRIAQPYRTQHRHESSHFYQTVADLSYRR
jgi:hypothetical protein